MARKTEQPFFMALCPQNFDKPYKKSDDFFGLKCICSLQSVSLTLDRVYFSAICLLDSEFKE